MGYMLTLYMVTGEVVRRRIVLEDDGRTWGSQLYEAVRNVEDWYGAPSEAGAVVCLPCGSFESEWFAAFPR
jgi:hypothetical protein